MKTDYDVILVGYGPVGQTLALLLGRAGLSTAVLERHPTLFNQPRAVHFDHEVGRIFQSAGLAEQVRAVSEPTPFALFEYKNADRKVLARLPVGGPGQSGWPSSSSFAQQHLETVIDKAVRAQRSVKLFTGWACVGLTQNSDAAVVKAWFTNGDTQTISARYVVGVDGCNSFVRSRMATTETDLGFSSDWLVVTIIYKPGAKRLGLVQICDPARSITVAPGGPDRQRLEFMFNAGETAEQMSKPETAWSLLAEFGLNPDTAVLERHAVYRFGAKYANQWRDGRVLIAGDAAHLMPPFRAQGLCSGIRDAAALAWRLPLVLSGAAPATLLDSYGPERIPHVAEWIKQSVKIGELICLTDPVAAKKRDEFMAAMAADPSLAPPVPPPPKLGPGVSMDGDPLAGELGFQGVVEVEGKLGLFDDLVGHGFSLIGTTIDPVACLSPTNRAWFARLGGIIAQVSHNGPIRDVEGGYAAFYERYGVGVILARPDFHIFGAAAKASEVDGLVTSLRAKLGMAASTSPVLA